MRKLLQFVKYFAIGLICSNVPFVVSGMIFGFYPILFTAILLAFFIDQTDIRSIVLLKSGITAYSVTTLYFLYIGDNENIIHDLGPLGFTFIPMALSSLVVSLTHNVKVVYNDER